MRQLRDSIVRKRPRRPAPDTEDAPVSDFRELAAARNASARDGSQGDTDIPSTGAQDRDNAFGDISMESEPAPSSAPDTADSKPGLSKAKAKRSQIWEIEAADDEKETDEEAANPRRTAKERAAEAEQVLKQMQEQDLEQDRRVAEKRQEQVTRQSRAKTRILGFHNDDIEPDVFAAPPAAPAGRGEYPAGWLIVVEGPGRGACFTVGAGVSSIGRELDQTICLSFGDNSISRENHASIAYDEEQNRFFIGHGGKANLVRRNGTPVLTTEELFDADHIRIGKTTLRFVALCGPDFSWGPDEDLQDANVPNS